MLKMHKFLFSPSRLRSSWLSQNSIGKVLKVVIELGGDAETKERSILSSVTEKTSKSPKDAHLCMLCSTILSTRPWSWSSVKFKWNLRTKSQWGLCKTLTISHLFFIDCTELELLLKQGSWEPALMMSTRFVNLSWCFLAATRPAQFYLMAIQL